MNGLRSAAILKVLTYAIVAKAQSTARVCEIDLAVYAAGGDAPRDSATSAAKRDRRKERREGQDSEVVLHGGARLLLRQGGEQAIHLLNRVVVGEAGADDAGL